MQLCNFYWKEYQRTIGFRLVSVQNDCRHYVRHSMFCLVDSTELLQSIWNSENGSLIGVSQLRLRFKGPIRGSAQGINSETRLINTRCEAF